MGMMLSISLNWKFLSLFSTVTLKGSNDTIGFGFTSDWMKKREAMTQLILALLPIG